MNKKESSLVMIKETMEMNEWIGKDYDDFVKNLPDSLRKTDYKNAKVYKIIQIMKKERKPKCEQ